MLADDVRLAHNAEQTTMLLFGLSSRHKFLVARSCTERLAYLIIAYTGGAPKPYKGPSEYQIWLYTIHGWLMGVAWGALAPAGILVAYKFRNLPSRGLWFQIHRAMMVSMRGPVLQ